MASVWHSLHPNELTDFSTQFQFNLIKITDMVLNGPAEQFLRKTISFAANIQSMCNSNVDELLEMDCHSSSASNVWVFFLKNSLKAVARRKVAYWRANGSMIDENDEYRISIDVLYWYSDIIYFLERFFDKFSHKKSEK